MHDKAAPAGKVDMPHQAKANLSALIESTEDLIWSVDLDYRLIAFNQAVRQNIWDTLGVRLEAGMRLHELLPPDRTAPWLTFFERVLREGPFRVEYSLILPRLLELSFNPIVSDGGTNGISVFGKDITERKATECALKEPRKNIEPSSTARWKASSRLPLTECRWQPTRPSPGCLGTTLRRSSCP